MTFLLFCDIVDICIICGIPEHDLPVYVILFADHKAEYRYLVDAQTGHIPEHTAKPTDPES